VNTALASCPQDVLVCNPFGPARAQIYGLLRSFLPEPFATIIMTVIAIAVVTTFVALVVMLLVWAERRIVAYMQGRLGPNRVGPGGLLQSVADAVKLLTKEIIVPTQADRLPFILAPLIVVIPALVVWSIIPWGPGLSVTDLNVGVLAILALGTLPTIGILMAGWASANKYAVLGGLRVAAQLISYEIPMILTVMVPVILAGTMSLGGIVAAQSNLWFIAVLPVGPVAFLLFLITGLAEVNRSPFDLPEAESEIVAGFHTEYSGMAFALFFLAEYANSFAIAAMASILFLGGWHGPLLPPFVWMLIKMSLMFFVIVWIRGTLPRLRYDQLMNFAWKVALPIALVTVGATAVIVAFLKGMVA
jgi:NADH-quinone oxidoreductase subunit H